MGVIGAMPPELDPQQVSGEASRMQKKFQRPRLRPGFRWESLQHSAGPPANGEGLAVPSPRTPSLLSAIRASPLTRHRGIGHSQHDGLDPPMVRVLH